MTSELLKWKARAPITNRLTKRNWIILGIVFVILIYFLIQLTDFGSFFSVGNIPYLAVFAVVIFLLIYGLTAKPILDFVMDNEGVSRVNLRVMDRNSAMGISSGVRLTSIRWAMIILTSQTVPMTVAAVYVRSILLNSNTS